VRASRTRQPATTGQRTRDARAATVERGAAARGDSIALTEPVVRNLNATFSEYIARMNVWSQPRWAFPATVGTTVPGWVQVRSIPSEIVAVYPDFAGDDFVVAGDDIVIVEPAGRRIVAMISRTSNTAVAVYAQPSTAVSSTTGLAPMPEERVRLTRAQIATIRTVMRNRTCRYERSADFSVGSLMPAAAPVCAFPARVVAAVPDIADYRYITRRGAVVVVDPGNDRVVTVLR